MFLFYVETRGPTLEEIAKIFDGNQAQIGVANAFEVKADMEDMENTEKIGMATFRIERKGE